MTKKNLKRLLIGVSALALLIAVAIPVVRSWFYGEALKYEAVIRIDDSTTYSDVEAQIHPLLRTAAHRKAFDIYARRLNLAERFHQGKYKFSKGESVVNIVRALAVGGDNTIKLVVGEARTLPQLAERLSAQIYEDASTLLSAMRNEQIRKELGYEKDSIIAMFIPNTYEVYASISANDLLSRISRENSRFWSAERSAKLERCKLSKYEVMTLASIVYEETKYAKEMPTVAGVYINRLRRGMPLQADPTVKYAMGDFSIKRVLHKHLKHDSPFNTYMYKGLPPAPICIPSIEAIDAVLNYEEHKYLFFCAHYELNGTHIFARTLKEHNRNAHKYSEALNRLGIK